MASDGMIGRVYIWRGQRWRVLVRWRTPDRDEPYTWIAPCCGHVVVGDYRGREVVIVGDESYCAECGAMWTERRPAGHCCIDGWQPGGRAVVRNVLIENVETGERTVRPFRGLRRA